MSETTGTYSNRQIFEGIESGNIVVHPFNPAHVNGSSIDVTLGYNFYRTDQSTLTPGIYNPYDEEDVRRYFGEALQAQPLDELGYLRRTLGREALRNIPGEQPVIIMRPNERILAHTHEFIGIRQGTSSMQARSTTGRNGIVVCMDAGWGDPGYINRWTMEIKNMNEKEAVPLIVGGRIAQIVLYHTGVVDGEYSVLSGKYQTDRSDDIETIVKNWRPEQMLPKAYKDEMILPTPVAGLSEGVA